MAILTAPAPSGGDDQTALQNFLNSFSSGDYASFPQGAVYRHSGRLLYKNAAQNVTIMAEGVVWEATDSSKATFFFDGAVNVEIVGLWHRTATKPTTRINLANDVGPFAFNSTTGVKLRRVRSSGSAGLSYYFWNFRDGEITDCIAEDSLADGFHFTNGSRNFTVAGCVAVNNGDDAFAFIGYQADGATNGQPQFITLTNPVVRDCRARGISMAGAKNITVNNPDIDGTLAANIYFAVERGDFNTLDTADCTVNGGRITRAGTSYPAISNGTDGAGKDQGSILWLSSGSGAVVTRCVANDVSVGSTGAANYDTFRAIQYGGTFVGCAANRTQLFSGAPSTYIGGNIPSAISPATSTDRRTETLTVLDSVYKPTFVNSVSTDAASTALTTYTLTVPANVKASDVGIIQTSWVPGASTDTHSYSGPGTIVQRLAPTAFTNMISVAYTITGVKAGDVLQFTFNAARFFTSGAVWYSDARVETVGAATGRASSVATVVAAAINEKSSSSLSVILATERTTATGTVVSSVSPGPTTQRLHREGAGSSTCAVTFLDSRPTTYTTNTAPAQTVTYNSASTNGGAMQIEMAYQKATATTSATVSRATLGLPSSTSIRAAAKLVGASSARLAVSTASSMAGASYSASRTPDSLGYVGGQGLPMEVAGLTADSTYYWQMELDGVLVGPIGTTRTLPAVGSAQNFGFAAGCCNATGSDVLVFDAIRTMTGANSKTAAFFAHLGDIHYFHSASGGNSVTEANDPTEIASHYEASLGTPRQSALYRTIPLSHSFSDNDFAGSNSDSTFAAAATVTATRRRLLADPTLPGTGLYKTWVVGRVRFIQTDSRSFLGAKGANGAYLGSTQKQWFKDVLSAATEPMIFWFNDNNWAGTATSSTALDDWRNYPAERTEISSFIQGISGLSSRLIFVHGDSHSLAYDSGANNPFGSFPMINVGPLNQNSSDHPAVNVYDGGKYPATNGVASQQFGWFDIVDNGTAVTATFKGYSVDSATGATTQRMTYSRTYTPPTPPRVDVEAIPGTLSVIKADSLSAVANGANVTSWVDKKSRWTLVPGNVAPTKVAAGALNNKPAVRFNGTNQNLKMDNAPALAQPFTIGVVLAPTTVTGDKQIVWQGNGGEAAIYQSQWFEYSGSAYSLTSPVPTTGGKVLTFGYNADLSAILVNGAAGTPATGNPGAVGMTAGTLFVMDHGTVDRYFGGDLYELRVWDHVLTEAERVGWHSYCQDEYGVAVADYKSGTQVSTGSAALTGSGTASSVSVPNHVRAGALSGSGTASPAATAAFAAAASPNGSGTATPVGVGGYPGVGVLSGSGAVNYGVATPRVVASFPLSGSGTTASKVGNDYANASIASGSGSVVTAATTSILASALETGSGTTTYTGAPAIGSTGSVAWNTYFTDNYNRTQSSPITGYDANAAWSTNGSRLINSSGSVSFLAVTNPAPSLNHRMSVVQHAGANNGICVRVVDSQNYYGFRRSGANAQMFTAIGGVITLVGSAVAAAPGDRLTLTATESGDGTATILQAQVNDGTVQTVIFTSASQRINGLKYAYRAQTTSNTNCEFDDLQLSTLVSTPAGVPAGTSGSGTATISGVQGFAGAASTTGSGSLSAVVLASSSGTGAATGGSNVLAVGSAISGAQSSQTITGSGTVTTTQAASASGFGSASGSGSVLAVGAPRFAGAGAATGDGVVNTSSSTSPSGLGNATGNGVLDITRVVAFAATAALSGSGAVAPAGRPAVPASAAPSGSGSTSVVLAEGYFGSRTLTGSGTAAGAGVPNTGRVGLLTGSGTTTTAATLAPVATAAVSGSGTLVATGTPAFTQASSASGLGVVNTAALVSVSGSGSANSSGTADRTVQFAVSASAAVMADGYATPLNGAADFRKSVTLSGAGSLSAVQNTVVAAGTGAATGGSSVSYLPPTITLAVLAGLTGSGSLLSSSIAGKSSEVVGLGGGSRVVTLDRSAVFQAAVAFGTGDIATALRLTANGRVVLFGEGLLTGIYGEDYRDVDLDVGPPFTNSRAYRPVDRLRKV